MHEVFKDFLRDELVSYVDDMHLSWKVLTSMPKGAGSSILFLCREKTLRKFIQIRFVPDKYHVEFNLQWSRLNRFPDELCIDPISLPKIISDPDALKARQEAWISGGMLGGLHDASMSHKEPDDQLLMRIYSPENMRALVEYVFDATDDLSRDSFLALGRQVGWDMLIGCFGVEVLNHDDISRAVGGLLGDAKKFVSEIALPFLNDIH